MFLAHKALSYFFFGMSMLSLATGIIAQIFSPENQNSGREWGDIAAITFCMCGLFVKIRNSKPVFSRFPILLTFLPLIGLLFYPLIINSIVVKQLLNAVYQGGSIIVAALIVTINQIKHRERGYLLSATLLFGIAFVLFWLIPEEKLHFSNIPANLLFCLGIILAIIGFIKSDILKE